MTTAVSPSVGKGKNKTYDPYALRKSAKTPWGNPVVYFFSLLLVALCVGPVLYIIIGGFRTNAQITRDPAGWPDPWNFGPIGTFVVLITVARPCGSRRVGLSFLSRGK